MPASYFAYISSQQDILRGNAISRELNSYSIFFFPCASMCSETELGWQTGMDISLCVVFQSGANCRFIY